MSDDANTETPMLRPKIRKGRKLNQYIAATTVSLGAVCAGTCLSWTSPAFAQLSVSDNSSNITNASTKNFYLTKNQEAVIGAILTVGALVAAIPTGYLADKFGRKKVILCVSLTFLLNWIITIFAQDATTIIVGRFFAGIGTGAICVVGPVYIGEIAETSIRGTLEAFISMALCSGILLTCIFGSFTSWRALSIILAVVPVLFGICFFFMPETPAYLVRSDKLEQAKKSLIHLRGSKYDINTELEDIQQEIQESREKTANIFDIFTNKANRKAFFSVVPAVAFQQLCGVNAVVFYTVPIFTAAGSSLSPDLAGIMIALVQVLAAFLSVFIIEKANRKIFLMFSSTGMLLFLTSLGMYFHLQKLQVDISDLGFLPIGSAVLYMICFAVGYGPVPWMLMGELFSSEVKGFGNGIAILTSWGCAFLVTFLFPIISHSIGAHVFFYVCAAIMAFATVYVYLVVPETRGKTLSEIQEILNHHNIPIFRCNRKSFFN